LEVVAPRHVAGLALVERRRELDVEVTLRGARGLPGVIHGALAVAVDRVDVVLRAVGPAVDGPVVGVAARARRAVVALAGVEAWLAGDEAAAGRRLRIDAELAVASLALGVVEDRKST